MSPFQLNRSTYRGRFAPSPTGPLHFGSLVSAVGSYLQARKQNGQWLLRIDDIDPPREQKGAVKHIIKTLDHYGFEWDEEILYQSQRYDFYQNALEQLVDKNHCFSCQCSRKNIQYHVEKLDANPHIYPGTCRNRPAKNSSTDAIRIKSIHQHIRFKDLLQGDQCVGLADEIGDFIIRRSDGLYAYQLATTVDDAEQAITEVVRGSDLLSSTPHQYYLQQLLGYSHPSYLHLPLVINIEGEKLSKQTFAKAIEPEDATTNLTLALQFLGQNPDSELSKASTEDIWLWAIEHWQVHSIPPHSHSMIESPHG
ncbi:MAG: tRNA glutamyl-Q(34) synthetase GluQRS [Chromatiales bacterium]|nr:tRNA glutamyl-Q(34) synthetase GluQRS [Chromatiales bacterium]